MSQCPKAVSAAFGFGPVGSIGSRRRFEESDEEYVQRVTREHNISDEEWASAISATGGCPDGFKAARRRRDTVTVRVQNRSTPGGCTTVYSPVTAPGVRQCETKVGSDREYGSAGTVDKDNNGKQTLGNIHVPTMGACFKQVPPRAQQAWGDGVRVHSTAEAAQKMHAAVDEAISALSRTGTADKLQALTGSVCALCSMSPGFDESRFVHVPATGSVGAHVGSLAQGFGGLAASH